MSEKQPYFILVEPQLAENVGMAARAMMNCGIYNLRLVKPRENHLSDKAIAASSNAEEILYKAELFDTTENAIADLNFVLATTARHRDQVKPVLTADKAAQKLDKELAAGAKGGILFGPERTGLNNHDVCLADAIINIPLNPRHCSLNLSQAVLLAGYEFHKLQITQTEEQLVINHSDLADKNKVLQFCSYLESKLEDCGNFREGEKRDKMVTNLRNIFTRNQMTEQEINTLYGVVNHLLRGSK